METPEEKLTHPNLKAQVDGPWFLGPATFMKVPALSEPAELDQWKPDVAVVGAPWDDSTTYRPGARFGPRAVRTANYQPPTWHLDLEVAPFDVLRVVDYGDAVCNPGLPEQAHEAIRQRVHEVASRRIVPLVIGGDHSITFPSATAVADAYGRGLVGMVHFDAHADTGDAGWGGFLLSHATPMRRLIESGAIPGHNFVQVGHLMGELLDRGVEVVVAKAIEEALDGPEFIYLSVDIDVLDPGFAPGTGTPEPGGMQPADLLRAIRNIALQTTLVGMDVVEVSPPYDQAEVTAQNANRCMLEAISALAKKRGRVATP